MTLAGMPSLADKSKKRSKSLTKSEASVQHQTIDLLL